MDEAGEKLVRDVAFLIAINQRETLGEQDSHQV